MDKPPASTRDRILQAAYGLFYREGFARVSVDAIAARAQVTKRTVYYHFSSKDDVAAAALTAQHDYLLRQYSQWLGSEAGDAAQMIDSLFVQLARWASGILAGHCEATAGIQPPDLALSAGRDSKDRQSRQTQQFRQFFQDHRVAKQFL